jgi:ABC-type Fe3+-hydroxamate transport system substrate-binding protein
VACTQYCEQPDLLHVGGTKNPDIDTIVALEPDVVLVDRVENRREDAEALTARGLHVVDIDVRTLADVDREMATVARAVGLAPPPPIRLPLMPAPSTSVFVPIWRRPWMTIGPETYGSTLLAAIGARNVFHDADRDFPETSLDEVASLAPELVLVPSEPYEFKAAHLEELAAIAPVVEVDGQDLFWWGARTTGALERLRTQLASLAGERP